MRRSLVRKLEYFIHSHRRGRQEVGRFLDEVAAHGRFAIVGGMVRDLHLEGNRAFSSDIDLVAYDCSQRAFTNRMISLGARRNRFGGFKLPLRHWIVEVWHLENTWARQAGVAPVQSLHDILHATFFDWDAILYDLKSRQLIAEENYFERVNSRVLDVRLEENPNPFGNAVRALRYAIRWRAVFAPRLSEHVLREVRNAGWTKVVNYDAGFRQALLAEVDGVRVLSELRAAVNEGSHALVVGPHTSRQQNLQLPEGGRQLAFPWHAVLDECGQVYQ